MILLDLVLRPSREMLRYSFNTFAPRFLHMWSAAAHCRNTVAARGDDSLSPGVPGGELGAAAALRLPGLVEGQPIMHEHLTIEESYIQCCLSRTRAGRPRPSSAGRAQACARAGPPSVSRH